MRVALPTNKDPPPARLVTIAATGASGVTITALLGASLGESTWAVSSGLGLCILPKGCLWPTDAGTYFVSDCHATLRSGVCSGVRAQSFTTGG